MSEYLETLYDGLRTVITQAWPDISADGIFEADHLDLLPVQDLTPPYAVISLSTVPQDKDYSSVDSLSFLPVLDIYAVEAVSGPRSPIRAKLEALRDILWTVPLEYGQVMEILSLSWSTDIEMNALFAAKSLGQRAGRLQVSVLVGEILPQA